MGVASVGVWLTGRAAGGAGGGYVYSWLVPDDGRRGWMLFVPAERVFRECDGTGAVPGDGMEVHVGLSEEEAEREQARWEDRPEWRVMVTAAVGVWRRFRADGEPPETAHRTFW
ncbi:hypothetical protein CUT44_12150 [Streptomyces carminius]|uniref:Uncharacterized protein n=1 Tax=Streptomyces carminius TaxID=2665496 RepID=A0A2M8LZS0_9ACTN|nr:hypothetical protein [Streptomyces carminius]PJE97430.1 hypothetical protein CUT44_12150 [Streptomyces carminius]